VETREQTKSVLSSCNLGFTSVGRRPARTRHLVTSRRANSACNSAPALRYVSAPFSCRHRSIRHELAKLSRYQVESRSAVAPLIPPCRPLFLRPVTRARDCSSRIPISRRSPSDDGKSKQAMFVLVARERAKIRTRLPSLSLLVALASIS